MDVLTKGAIRDKQALKYLQESLVKTHFLMVKRIAQQLFYHLPPGLQIEDLIQSGLLGLLEAVRLYDPSKGASFETYASIRIRGHILDEVRRYDWLPRSVHRQTRMISEATKKIEHESGREAKAEEVAAALNIDLETYYMMKKQGVACQMQSFEEEGSAENYLEVGFSSILPPHIQFNQNELMKRLEEALRRLPERERLVLSLYYYQDVNLKEIGEMIGVSESRVCQIHSQATQRLKGFLAD